MKCTKCGAEIKEGTQFCSSCGAPVNPQTTENTSNNEATNIFEPQDNQNTSAPIFDSASSGPVNNANVQMPYNNANIQTNIPTTPNNTNKKTPWALIVGVVVLAIVIVAVFVGISISKEDNNSNNTSANTSENTESNKQGTKGDTKTVTYSDFTFTVPEDYTATPSSSQLLITGGYDLAEAVIYQSGTTYDTLASMKDKIIDLLKTQQSSSSYDFTSAVTTEATYGGKRFLVTSGIKQGTTDLDITYGEAEGGVFVVSIARTSGNITESDRTNLYSIVASAK